MRLTKKLLCALLSLCILATLAVPVSAESRTGGAVPIIYVQGQGAPLVDAQGRSIDNDEVPDGYITDAVKACMPTFVKALTSDDWDEYNALLESYVLPFFDGYQLDKNGEPSDGSHVNWGWSRSSLRDKRINGVYSMNDYIFYQDWRIDPFETARVLDRYIQDIKSVTGSDKVNLVGRCEGGNVLMAYLAEFGSDDVNCMELYCHSILGVDAAGAAFSGKIRLDSESINRFVEQDVEFDDDIVSEFIDATLEFATETYGLDLAAAGAGLIVKKVYKNVLIDLIMKTYGTFPGIWSLIGPDYYAEARKNIFEGKQEEYAGLIEKLDDYDVRVRTKTKELLYAARDNGTKIAVYAKYGYQAIPISSSNNKLSDNTVTLESGSLGATCANYNKTLSDSYISKAQSNGTAKYISPDKKVDASTCLFPDTTWIIYKNEHKDFPEGIHSMMLQFFRSNGEMTVFSDPSSPQYLVYDEQSDTVSPMTGDDVTPPEPEKPKTKESFKEMALRFLRSLFAFIKQLFSKKD